MFSIAINKETIGKLPEDFSNWGYVNGRFVNEQVTTQQFADYLQAGYAWCSPIRRYRDRKNFLLGQVIGVDIDKGDTPIGDIMSIPFVDKYAAIVHSTPSSTPEHPRHRIIFILSSPIKNRHKFETLVDSLITSFTTITTDKACKDAARLFYGAPGCEIIVRDKQLPLMYALLKLAKPYMKEQERKRQEYLESIKNHKIHYNGATPNYLLEMVRNKLVEEVLSAPEGQKAYTLNKVAYTFGGYVAGAYFDQHEAIYTLKEAISARGSVRNMNLAETIIEKGIQKGMNSPLLITEEDGFAEFGL